MNEIISNFISTLDMSLPVEIHHANLLRDYYTYEWNEYVYNEIYYQILEKYGIKP